MEQDLLDEEAFDLAATRPALTFGLPHTLSATLLLVAILGIFAIDYGDFETDTILDVVWIGAIGMGWSAAKIMLRVDYHGWDIFVAWLRLDARFLDTREWGGAHLSSLPLHSIYRCWVYNNAD